MSDFPIRYSEDEPDRRFVGSSPCKSLNGLFKPEVPDFMRATYSVRYLPSAPAEQPKVPLVVSDIHRANVPADARAAESIKRLKSYAPKPLQDKALCKHPEWGPFGKIQEICRACGKRRTRALKTEKQRPGPKRTCPQMDPATCHHDPAWCSVNTTLPDGRQRLRCNACRKVFNPNPLRPGRPKLSEAA